MGSNFKFPLLGWKTGWSDSYGADDLFKGMDVILKTFPESESGIARATYDYLRNHGISTVIIDEVNHLDGKNYVYVFFDQKEFWSNKDRLFSDVQVLVTPKSRNNFSTEVKIAFVITLMILVACVAYITNSIWFLDGLASLEELLRFTSKAIFNMAAKNNSHG